MNDVSSPAPGASLLPDSTSLITSVHFILLALFAVAVLAMIIVGIARKRARTQADAELAERIEEHDAGEPPVPADATPAPHAEEPIAPAAPHVPSPIAALPEAGTPLFALTQLKGLGPKVAAQMESIGIRTVDQLAALSDADADRVDGALGPFAGRLSRDRWVEQARLLAAGDRAGFEAKFGKL